MPYHSQAALPTEYEMIPLHRLQHRESLQHSTSLTWLKKPKEAEKGERRLSSNEARGEMSSKVGTMQANPRQALEASVSPGSQQNVQAICAERGCYVLPLPPFLHRDG